MFDIKKFGAYISALRKKADMTQSDLADKLYLTRQAISKYERGLSFPDISILTMIAEMFYITIDNLIYAGEPTENEAELLLGGLSNEIESIGNAPNVINISPLLNINQATLEKIAEKFLTKGIDISNIIEFSKSLTENDLIQLYRNETYDTIDEDLLGKLIPVMNDNARMNIIEQIFDGKVHHRVIIKLLQYEKGSDNFDSYLREELFPLLEEAVIYGLIEHEILQMIWDYYSYDDD